MDNSTFLKFYEATRIFLTMKKIIYDVCDLYIFTVWCFIYPCFDTMKKNCEKYFLLKPFPIFAMRTANWFVVDATLRNFRQG